MAHKDGRDETNARIRRSGMRGGVRSILRALPSSTVVVIASLICYAFHLGFPTVSFFFLVVVVIHSLAGDFLSSAVVSVISFLCLNFFFVPPILSLRVSDPSDTLALISFLITGLVITGLTSRAQAAADSEKLHRTEMTRLYELARHLLSWDSDVKPGTELLRPFRSQFGLRAVCLFDGVSAQLHLEGDTLDHLAERTRTAYISQQDFQDRTCGVSVRVLRIADRTIGAIGFEGLRELDLTAEPLAALVAVMIERSRAFQRASHAAAAAEAEVFRGAMLDALAHEFKTPLATILTAAGGLRETGPLRSEQRDLAEVVETEASRLGQLTSRLLRLARLDREEVKPQMELTDLANVVRSVVDQHARRWPDRHLHLVNCDRVTVLGDQELLWLALGQLLDNACKYSKVGTDITISIESADESVAVRVWNGGPAIPSAERTRIFDRFYRGVEARNLAPGSGLGLYVARKIALAHGGTLDLDQYPESSGGTGFRFIVPTSKSELGHDTEIQCTSGR